MLDTHSPISAQSIELSTLVKPASLTSISRRSNLIPNHGHLSLYLNSYTSSTTWTTSSTRFYPLGPLYPVYNHFPNTVILWLCYKLSYCQTWHAFWGLDHTRNVGRYARAVCCEVSPISKIVDNTITITDFVENYLTHVTSHHGLTCTSLVRL